MAREVLINALMILSLGGAALAMATANQEPVVTTAVAPVFPRLAATLNASGRVIVEARVNREGKVISVSIVEGNPLFRQAAENAARLWTFAYDTEGNEVRSVRLTFVFTSVVDATEAELTPVFVPPFQVQVKHLVPPHVDVNVRPCPRSRSGQ